MAESVPMSGGRDSSPGIIHEDGDEAGESAPRSSMLPHKYCDLNSSVPRSMTPIQYEDEDGASFPRSSLSPHQYRDISPVHHRKSMSPDQCGDITDGISTWDEYRQVVSDDADGPSAIHGRWIG